MSQDSFRVKKSLNIQPTASPSLTELGDLAVDSATGKLSYRNASTASPLVAEAHTATLTNKTIDADLNTLSNIVDANIKTGAAIAYAKLNLSNSIVNADIASAAAIAYSKLALSNSIVNADIASAAAIAYSKLALSNSIVNADIATGANIDVAKLGALTASRALETNGSGVITPSTVTSTELGYLSGVTSSIQTQLGNKADTSALTAHTGASTGVHGVTGSVVGTSDTQTLTNKTLDAAIIDNGADFIEEASLTNPASGRRKLGLKTDGKLYLRDSSGNEVAVGTGSGGGINYILNPDAEANTTGWNTYADAAGTQPVDGTGGTANITFTRDTTTPLRNTAQFLLTKDAANRQGQGVSYDFTIDRADQAKRLVISFDYLVASGTYADGDIGVYIVDVTNNQVIQPAGFQVQNISGVAGKELATFQTASNSTSYRLCLHVASTSTSAYTLRIDNVQVGPVNATFSTPVTDWVSYTPTGSWTTNTTYLGRWRRVGDTMELQIDVNTSGAPTAGTLTLNLPSGYSIDLNKIGTLDNPMGQFFAQDFGVQSYAHGYVGYNSPTSVYLGNTQVPANAATVPATAQAVTNILPFTFGASDFIRAWFRVPISGWSSSAQVVSDSSEGRVVAMQASGSTTSINNLATATLVFPTVVQDTHGAYNSTTGVYTVRVPGWYVAECYAACTNAGTTAGGYLGVQFNMGGTTQVGRVEIVSGTARRVATVVSPPIFLTAGQTIEAVGDNQTGGNLTMNSASRFGVHMLQGSQTLLGGETVAARYTRSTSTNIVTDTLVDYATRDYDYTNSVTTGASWRFTAPVSGLYEVSAMFETASATAGAINDVVGLRLFKNGTLDRSLIRVACTSTSSHQKIGNGVTRIRLLAGEYIDIRGFNNTGQTHSISDANSNYVEITRIGNY